jgi:hypothetical protein
VKEDDELWVNVPEPHARKILTDKILSGSEIDALNELVDIKRRTVNKYWAI